MSAYFIVAREHKGPPPPPFPRASLPKLDCFFPRLSLFAHYTLTSAGDAGGGEGGGPVSLLPSLDRTYYERKGELGEPAQQPIHLPIKRLTAGEGGREGSTGRKEAKGSHPRLCLPLARSLYTVHIPCSNSRDRGGPFLGHRKEEDGINKNSARRHERHYLHGQESLVHEVRTLTELSTTLRNKTSVNRKELHRHGRDHRPAGEGQLREEEERREESHPAGEEQHLPTSL